LSVEASGGRRSITLSSISSILEDSEFAIPLLLTIEQSYQGITRA
jgi:hypothetical protein